MNQGILYTSYFAKFKKGIGDKISIARFNPKWLDSNELFAWCTSLAPSKELLNDYKYKGISWDEYTERYYDEIKNSEQAQFDISSICTRLILGHDITLYCYEKSTDNCHRHLLAELFKEKGFEFKEVE
jgi:uncharacterized protein YeaO (DUF488 family)